MRSRVWSDDRTVVAWPENAEHVGERVTFSLAERSQTPRESMQIPEQACDVTVLITEVKPPPAGRAGCDPQQCVVGHLMEIGGVAVRTDVVHIFYHPAEDRAGRLLLYPA